MVELLLELGLSAHNKTIISINRPSERSVVNNETLSRNASVGRTIIIRLVLLYL